MAKKVIKKAFWLTEIYEESAPLADVCEKLTRIGAQALISPEHCEDVNQVQREDGSVGYEKKKPHRHVILIWEGPTTYDAAKMVVDMIGGVGCLPAITFRGAARYHCHLDNPEKAQYNPADEIVIGGFDYQEIISSASDDEIALSELYDFLDEHLIFSFRQFNRYCRQFRRDWFRLMTSKHRENIFRYMTSLQHELETYGGKLPDLTEDGSGDTGFIPPVEKAVLSPEAEIALLEEKIAQLKNK